MQEEITQKTLAVAVTTAEMTAKVLARVLQAYLEHRKNKGLKNKGTKIYKGKQSLKQLMRQDAALSNISITNKNIGAFAPIARKYGIDFALKKGETVKTKANSESEKNEKAEPTPYYVFFKGKDVDVMNMAFQEYTAKILNKENKPSLRQRLAKMKEQVTKRVKQREKVKNKDRCMEL